MGTDSENTRPRRLSDDDTVHDHVQALAARFLDSEPPGLGELRQLRSHLLLLPAGDHQLILERNESLLEYANGVRAHSNANRLREWCSSAFFPVHEQCSARGPRADLELADLLRELLDRFLRERAILHLLRGAEGAHELLVHLQRLDGTLQLAVADRSVLQRNLGGKDLPGRQKLGESRVPPLVLHELEAAQEALLRRLTLGIGRRLSLCGCHQ